MSALLTAPRWVLAALALAGILVTIAVWGEKAEAASGCPAASKTVSNASQLKDALKSARPGHVIVLQPGTYGGKFVATVSGTATSPITLCGPRTAVLDAGSTSSGYVFHLKGAKYWRLIGFTVTNGQKGVMADSTVGSSIQGLNVHRIGDEGIHLRKNSTGNRVVGNTVSDTGRREAKYGEGVYVGSAQSNWCSLTGCNPDRSDRNLIERNYIHHTRSEAVDIKEGTTGGILRSNTFDGSSLSGADSWVDVKGNNWLIVGNVGANSPLDGFQTHEILSGWGTRNVFRGNVAKVNGPGYGFSLTPVRANVVECSNVASGASRGLANVACR